MEKYAFKKEKSGSVQMEIRYFGTVENDYNTKLLDEKIVQFISESLNSDIVRTVSSIRTILKDCEEQLLVIEAKCEDYSIIVKYDNEKLFYFEKIKKQSVDSSIISKVKYESECGMSFDFNDKENSDVINSKSMKAMKDEFESVLTYIEELKHAKAIEINKDASIIIEVYKNFYGELPDFSDKKTNLKIQTMAFILTEYGYSIGDYNFLLNELTPTSISLDHLIYTLYPLGKIDNNNDIKLSKDAINAIEIIRKELKNYIDDETKLEDILCLINKVLYINRYRLSSNASCVHISEYSNLTLEEVKDSKKILNKIKRKLYNE